jgi:hypothetical protein
MKKFLIAVCMVALMAAPALADVPSISVTGAGSLSAGGSTVGTIPNGGIQASGALALSGGIGHEKMSSKAVTDHFGYTIKDEFIVTKKSQTILGLRGIELQRSSQAYTESSALANTKDACMELNIVAGAGISGATSSITGNYVFPGKAGAVAGGVYLFAGVSGDKITGSGSSLSNAGTFKGMNDNANWTGSYSNNITTSHVNVNISK